LTQSFRPHYGPGVDSASNRNEYHKYFLGVKSGRCVGLTTLPLSCPECLEIWNRLGLFRPAMGLFYNFYLFTCSRIKHFEKKIELPAL